MKKRLTITKKELIKELIELINTLGVIMLTTGAVFAAFGLWAYIDDNPASPTAVVSINILRPTFYFLVTVGLIVIGLFGASLELKEKNDDDN